MNESLSHTDIALFIDQCASRLEDALSIIVNECTHNQDDLAVEKRFVQYMRDYAKRVRDAATPASEDWGIWVSPKDTSAYWWWPDAMVWKGTEAQARAAALAATYASGGLATYAARKLPPNPLKPCPHCDGRHDAATHARLARGENGPLPAPTGTIEADMHAYERMYSYDPEKRAQRAHDAPNPALGCVVHVMVRIGNGLNIRPAIVTRVGPAHVGEVDGGQIAVRIFLAPEDIQQVPDTYELCREIFASFPLDEWKENTWRWPLSK